MSSLAFLAFFYRKLEEKVAKAEKLAKDLKVITNTKLGSGNEALQSKVETLASTEAVLKIKLEVVAEDVRQAEGRVLAVQSLKMTVESAPRQNLCLLFLPSKIY
ncbi:hypothetical protein Adt_40460 [Abeliophyllum distichum]|uniref:Uncharacterized protein n=1 Tax=Abeliophyllum distichum TaxID=126358 RepID=A0ABD1Q7Z8_9LAMI